MPGTRPTTQSFRPLARFATGHLAAALLLVGILCAGCGGPRDGTIRVKGRVTYDGAPVPTGRIDFLPAGDQANAGRGGYAIIKGGEFDTRDNGKGPSPGKYLARVSGFDGSAPRDAESNFGTLLFQGYEQEIVVAPDQEEVLIEVPKSGKSTR